MTSQPTIVVCLFDQKSGPADGPNAAKLAELKRVPYTASDIVRYCARLGLLPSPYAPAVDVPSYITRGGEVGAVAFRNFNLDDLAGMTRELEQDAQLAPKSLSRPWIHGCISMDVSPADYESDPADPLDMGHALMKMFGVDKNRYMLAVHLDSGKIHVHFLYCRVDTEGRLRERDRKMPKFMAEEATALLAHQFGYSLEPHHLSRGTPKGVLDLASDHIVRDLQFREMPQGMKARNTARKKTKRNELLTLALVARYEANDLMQFRELLAPHGITYERAGSGAEFIDINGDRLKASDVDQKRRFTPTHMFNGSLLTDFPDTPEELRREAERVRADAMLARDIHAHANLASKTSKLASDNTMRRPMSVHNDKDEIERFFADRDVSKVNGTESEGRWDKAAIAAMKLRRGRPLKDPIAPGWPAATKFDGFLGSRAGHQRRVKFSEPAYQTLERSWQTEIWREGHLIASVRYSRMAILSNKDDDLREALLAAHRAWGSVEIFGKPKFKLQMAKLAAELNIPISNPELREGIARINSARRPTAKLPPAVKSANRDIPNLPASRTAPAPTPRPATMSQSAVGMTSMPLASSAAEQASDQQARVPRPDILSAIRHGNWAIRRDASAPAKWTLYDRTMTAFCVDARDLESPAAQAQLASIYQQQQADLAAISTEVRSGAVPVLVESDAIGRETLRLQILPGAPVESLHKRCQSHPDVEASIKVALYDFREEQRLMRMRASEEVAAGVKSVPPVSHPPGMETMGAPTAAASADISPMAEPVSRVEEAPDQTAVMRPPPADAPQIDVIPDIGKGKDIQNDEVKRLEGEARQAAELADIMRPRILGAAGGSKVAATRASLPPDDKKAERDTATLLTAIKSADRETPTPVGDSIPPVPTSAPATTLQPAVSITSTTSPASSAAEQTRNQQAQVTRPDILSIILENNWAIRRDPAVPARWTLYDREMRGFRVEPRDLERPESQAELAKLYRQQQAELATISAAVRSGTVVVFMGSDAIGRETIRLQITPGSPLERIDKRCQLHPDFNASIKVALHDFREGQRLIMMRASEEVDDLGVHPFPPVSPPAGMEPMVAGTVAASAGIVLTAEPTSQPVNRVEEAPDQTAVMSPSPGDAPPMDLFPDVDKGEDIKNDDFKRLEYEARHAAELADIMRPRILGAAGGSKDAATRASLPPDDKLAASKGTPLSAVKEQSPCPPAANPHLEAAKAAAISRQK